MADNDHEWINDAEADQFSEHVYDVCDRTRATLVEHYRPFVAGRSTVERVERFVVGTVGGSLLALGVRDLKSLGLSLEDVIGRIRKAWADDDKKERTPTDGAQG